MTAELRPCIVSTLVGIDIYGERFKREKALFHCWGQQEEEMCGIVEYEDGSVYRVNPHQIRFCDNKFSEYTFEGGREWLNT